MSGRTPWGRGRRRSSRRSRRRWGGRRRCRGRGSRTAGCRGRPCSAVAGRQSLKKRQVNQDLGFLSLMICC